MRIIEFMSNASPFLFCLCLIGFAITIRIVYDILRD